MCALYDTLYMLGGLQPPSFHAVPTITTAAFRTPHSVVPTSHGIPYPQPWHPPCHPNHTPHVIPGKAPPHHVIPTTHHVIPSGAKRSRGIFRTRFNAGHCQDSSTPLRSGRNDRRVCHPAPSMSSRAEHHPTLSSRAKRSEVEGSSAPPFNAGHCQDSSIPLRSSRNDRRFCHPQRSTTPHMSSRAERSEVEGSSAPGSTLGTAKIPPFRYAPVGMTDGGIFAPIPPPCHPTPHRVIPHPTVSSRHKAEAGRQKTWRPASLYRRF